MEDDPAMCEGINSGAFTHSSAIEVLSLLEIYKYILIHNTFYYLNYYNLIFFITNNKISKNNFFIYLNYFLI